MGDLINIFRKGMGKKPSRKARVYRPEDLPTIIVENPLGLKLAYINGEEVEYSETSENISLESKEEFDKIGPLPDNVITRNMLRRNSISLPNLDDLELQRLTAHVEKDGDDEDDEIKCDFSNESDISLSSDEDEVIVQHHNVAPRK